MSDTQLFMAIGIPMLFNGTILALINSNMNARINTLETRFAILTDKVAELSDRLARVEERLEHR